MSLATSFKQQLLPGVQAFGADSGCKSIGRNLTEFGTFWPNPAGAGNTVLNLYETEISRPLRPRCRSLWPFCRLYSGGLKKGEKIFPPILLVSKATRHLSSAVREFTISEVFRKSVSTRDMLLRSKAVLSVSPRLLDSVLVVSRPRRAGIQNKSYVLVPVTNNDGNPF